MTLKVPWLRVLAEGALIVVSILLGLGIDAWWDRRQAAALEADILSALAVEVASNQDILRSDRDQTEAALDRIDHFIRSEPEALGEVAADSVFLWIRSFIQPVTFDPLSGVAPLLEQTAVLSRDGIAIRARVSEWLTRVSDADEEKVEFRQRASEVQELLTSYAANTARQGAAILPAMIATLGPGVLTEMRRDQALVERIILKAAVQRNYLFNLNALAESLESLAEVLSSSPLESGAF
jgi:hypothetical protein